MPLFVLNTDQFSLIHQRQHNPNSEERAVLKWTPSGVGYQESWIQLLKQTQFRYDQICLFFPSPFPHLKCVTYVCLWFYLFVDVCLWFCVHICGCECMSVQESRGGLTLMLRIIHSHLFHWGRVCLLVKARAPSTLARLLARALFFGLLRLELQTGNHTQTEDLNSYSHSYLQGKHISSLAISPAQICLFNPFVF